jgi:hypothetical protein
LQQPPFSARILGFRRERRGDGPSWKSALRVANMPLSRTVLERQFERAKNELSAHVESLAKAGWDRAKYRSCVTWRALNAKCNQVQRRLNSLAKTEANDAAVAARKAEAAAAE